MTSCLRIRKRNLLRRLKQKIYFFKTFFKKIRRPADNLQDAVFFFIRNASRSCHAAKAASTFLFAPLRSDGSFNL